MSIAIKLEDLSEGFFVMAKEVKKDGAFFDKKIEAAKDQTAMKWYILAIVVGSIVVIGVGGFGAVGLLQSHGLITLPQSFHWLASAIGTIGHTPHFWSLYVVTGGGLLTGGALITFGSIKVHGRRQLRNHSLARIQEEKGQYEAQRDAITNSFNAENFKVLNLNSDQIEVLNKQVARKLTYSMNQFWRQEGNHKPIPENPPNYLIAFRTDQGELVVTRRLSQRQYNNIVRYFNIQGFVVSPPVP